MYMKVPWGWLATIIVSAGRRRLQMDLAPQDLVR